MELIRLECAQTEWNIEEEGKVLRMRRLEEERAATEEEEEGGETLRKGATA